MKENKNRTDGLTSQSKKLKKEEKEKQQTP